MQLTLITEMTKLKNATHSCKNFDTILISCSLTDSVIEVHYFFVQREFHGCPPLYKAVLSKIYLNITPKIKPTIANDNVTRWKTVFWPPAGNKIYSIEWSLFQPLVYRRDDTVILITSLCFIYFSNHFPPKCVSILIEVCQTFIDCFFIGSQK